MTQLMQSDLICGMFESLEKLTGAEDNADTRSSAGIIMNIIITFPFCVGKILPEVNDVQKYLQTKGLGLDGAVAKVQVLQKFLDDERYWLIDYCILIRYSMTSQL